MLPSGRYRPRSPGAEQPLAALRVVEEARRRARLVAPVAAGQADTGGADLPGDPVRGVATFGVEDVRPVVGVRPAVGDRLHRAVAGRDGVPDVPDGGLGRAAQGDQLQVRVHRPQPRRQVRRDAVAAHHHQPQRRRQRLVLLARVFGQQRDDGRHRVPHRDAGPPRERRASGRGRRRARGRARRRCARRQGAEHVVDGEIEVEGADGEEAVGRTVTPKRALQSATTLATLRWLIITPLGWPGGARGVEHVGQVVGRGVRAPVVCPVASGAGVRASSRRTARSCAPGPGIKRDVGDDAARPPSASR